MFLKFIYMKTACIRLSAIFVAKAIVSSGEVNQNAFNTKLLY